MKIGINFEDTLTDSNYSMIDVINSTRNRKDHIDYEDFDESGYHSIWDYPLLTEDEVKSKNKFMIKLFNTMDLLALSHQSINQLLELGHELQLFTEYSIDYKKEIEEFLIKKGLRDLCRKIVFGISEENINNLLKENEIEVYIEDNPYIIRECDGVNPLIIVRSHTYNETCYNLMRLECYSQLSTLIQRSEKKLEKIKLKKLKELEKEELKRLREAVRGK